MKRDKYLKQIDHLFKDHDAVAILGPRQIGKTTLAHDFAKNFQFVHRYDLEDPRDLARLENPMLTLENQRGLIVIDEIQRKEELFPVLRVLIDQHQDRKFLILGNASLELIKQSSETLAGRLAYLELPGFSILETNELKKLWIYGGFPKPFFIEEDLRKWEWTKNYVRNFIERDIPSLGINLSARKMRQLWHMLGHYNGHIINYSDLSRSLELTSTTIKTYVSILEGTLMLQRLPAWYENISKQQVKSPKILFKDSGILHYMLGIENWDGLMKNPLLGASWESFALRQTVLLNDFDENDCYHWSTHQGAELDLLVIKGSQRLGFEFKFSESPKVTKSMKIAMDTLRLNSLTIINPGKFQYEIADGIRVEGLDI